MIEGMANEGNFLSKIDRSNGDFRENKDVFISFYISFLINIKKDSN